MSEKIRVAAVINDVTLGGAQSVLLNIASLLDKKKFTFSVSYLRDFSSEGSPDLISQFEESGTTVTNLGRGKKHTILFSIFLLYRHLKKDKPDILHCCLPDAVIVGVIAGRMAGVKRILIHEMNTHDFYSNKLDLLFRLVRNFADLTISYSETLESELFGSYEILHEPIASLSRKSYTVYNGIDISNVDEVKSKISYEKKRAELGVGADEILIFSAARLIPWKGFEFLIKALPGVVAARSNFTVLIAGSGEQEKYLLDLINDLDLSSTVRLLGPRTDVYEILAVSDIYPQAYAYPDGLYSISISMSGMEAMAFGLPIIASRYPALYKNIEHTKNALVIEPKDIQALSDYLIYLLDSKEERERIGKEARLFVEEYFSLQGTVLIYESLYKALLVPKVTKAWKT